MIITVASYKGGQGKSTTAVHLASYFAQKASTLLVDGDPNRSVTAWAEGAEFPFRVVGEAQAPMLSRQYRHILIDTKARPDPQDLRDLAAGCHLLIVPCTPDAMALHTLMPMVKLLQEMGAAYRVLLTIVPPLPIREGEKAREALTEARIPLFTAQIPRAIAYQRSVEESRIVDSAEYRQVGREIEKLKLA